MSAAEEDNVEFSLAPQWLRGHGLHSPIGAGSTSSGRRDAPQLRSSNSRDFGLETPQLRKSQGLGSSRSAERPSSFRSPSRRSNGSSRPYLSSQRSSKASLEDRYHTLSSPFSSTAGTSNSSNSSSSAAASASSWLSQHTAKGTASLRPGDSQHGQNGVASLRGHSVLQRAVSEGSSAARSANSKVSRKLALDSQQFPSLADSSRSSNRVSSPEAYTPSVAPYKQEFLASRSLSSWTSQLAAVPGSDTNAVSSTASSTGSSTVGSRPSVVAAQASLKAAVGLSSRSSSPTQRAESTVDKSTAADKAAASPAVAAAPVAAAAALPMGTAAAAAADAATAAPSLADTLKQAAAAPSPSITPDATKRHSKALVPLVPGCKAKHGSSVPRTASARQGHSAKHAAAGASKPKVLGPPPAVVTHAAAASQSVLVPLGHSSSSSSSSGAPSSAPAATAPAAGPAHDKAAEAVVQGSNQATPQQQQQQLRSKGSGTAAAAASTEQRQQLRDRNSFFAVLRKKTGGATGADHTQLDAQQSSDSGSDAQLSTAAAAAAVELDGAAADTVQGTDQKQQQQQQHEHAGDHDGESAVVTSKPASLQQEQQQELEVSRYSPHPGIPSVVEVTREALSDNVMPGQPQVAQIHVAAAAVDGHRDAADDSVVSANIQHRQHRQQKPNPAEGALQASGDVSSSKQMQEQQKQMLQVPSSDQVKDLALNPLQDSKSQQQQQQQQQHMTWDLPSEEEEEAFLRSLGWTAGSSDDEAEWELTAEEIAAFQAAAACRAAQQQQQQQQQTLSPVMQQQKTNGMQQYVGYGQLKQGCGLGFAQQQQQQHLVRASDPGACYSMYGVPVARQSHCGLLFGVYMQPAVGLLGYDSDGSSSSDDD